MPRRSASALSLGFAAVAASVLSSDPALAGPDTAGVVTTVVGEAELARATEVLPLRFRDDLFPRDRIETGERSLVRVLLGGKALVTVRELSSLTITETPGHAAVDLRQGRVGLEVAKSLLDSGESVEIRTPNAIAAVRGSFVVVEVTLPGDVPDTRVITREVSLPVVVSTGAGVASLESDHVVSVVGAGATVKMSRPRLLTAIEIAHADRARSGPREATHDEGLPQVVEDGLAEDAAKAEEELEEIVLGSGSGGSDASGSDIGLNESAAARAAAGFGTDTSGLLPEPPTVGPTRRRSAAVDTVAPPPAPRPRGPGAPPPVGPPPSGAGPGFSHLSGGNATKANASPTGRRPPAIGLGGGAPPGRSN